MRASVYRALVDRNGSKSARVATDLLRRVNPEDLSVSSPDEHQPEFPDDGSGLGEIAGRPRQVACRQFTSPTTRVHGLWQICHHLMPPGGQTLEHNVRQIVKGMYGSSLRPLTAATRTTCQ